MNLNNLNALLDSGEIDKTKWKILFANVPDTRVPTCNDCRNRIDGSCREQGTPVDCFLYGAMSPSQGNLLNKNNTGEFMF